MKKGSNKLYINNTIYIIQYPGGKRLGVSYGILNGIYMKIKNIILIIYAVQKKVHHDHQ